MRSRLVILTAALFCLVGAAWATPVTYSVFVDTSSINGTTGSLDFNFNPGPLITQAASVQILGFSGNGVLGSTSRIGDATGTLPGTLTFDNATAFNDYFETYKFGSTLSFNVSLFGPALSAPNGVATSGSAFAFSLFSDPGGVTPVLTSDKVNGLGYVVNVNLNGSSTVTNYLTGAATTVTPEPGSGLLGLTGIAFGFAINVVRKGSRRLSELRGDTDADA